jgi:HAD superfamily hydrolase (TIGR01509 family)
MATGNHNSHGAIMSDRRQGYRASDLVRFPSVRGSLGDKSTLHGLGCLIVKTSSFAAVVFDMDGVLIDSEQVWDETRRRYAAENGGTWTTAATRAMQGMSSREWSQYMAEAVGVRGIPADINNNVLAKILQTYRAAIPFLPGARDAVARMAALWPLGLASSSNREIIDLVLSHSGLDSYFEATVSAEEVPSGKPAPDVYLAACTKLGVATCTAVAIEDSENGMRSAHTAGLTVVAIPNLDFPPDPTVLEQTTAIVLDDISQLKPDLVESLAQAQTT